MSDAWMRMMDSNPAFSRVQGWDTGFLGRRASRALSAYW
jgi:hypothetical protein